MVKASRIYGELTFNKNVMKEKLSKEVFSKIIDTIHNGEPLDQSIAGDIAHAMKEWAIENGATHFTHWFQPNRGGTAEKHDAFISYDGSSDIIERFSAMQLIQSEPDASSFPSGGIRSTFEARGYTAWDPTSPAFLLEAQDTRTLVVPSVFLSWTGEVLDVKTPLLRSIKAVNDAAIRLQKLLGNRAAKRIKVFAGPEQEYFLISKELYETRPDLRVCGRTLFGATPAKGQQMEDHYFGAISKQVIKFMEDLDMALYRRGIPAKTRHNEVAPNQFEIAPMYEEGNLSVDHNLQLMDILKQEASKHGLVALLNEKPFAGVNGSGKHLNWSIGDNTGANYLEPSASPLKNISFLMTLAAVMLGVDKFGGLLRASVADAGNDHRLGANEAPPAIMSVYLGEYLDALLNEIEGIGKLTDKKLADINLGIRNLPRIAKDTSDRNRTSPIAFTGNKFEFRAVGSSHNCAEPLTVLNLMVAYGYDKLSDMIEAKGSSKENAILVLKEVLQQTKHVRFEGNNYSDEWQKEAEKRGLPNAKNTPAALEYALKKESMELFEKYGVLAHRELESKTEIKLEAYIKIKDIEYKTAINMAKTMILPAVAEHISVIGGAASVVSSFSLNASGLVEDVKEAQVAYESVQNGIKGLVKALEECEAEGDLLKQAHLYAEKGASAFEQLRQAVDSAETVVADDLWPIAKYQELLSAF